MIKMLIAIDEPDLADVIVRTVCRTFDKSRLEVHLISVLETNLAENEYFLRNPESFLKRKAQLNKILDISDYFALQNVKYKDSHFKSGNAADEIVKFAQEGAFSIVVVGSHNKNFVDRFLVGSTSYKVVKGAPCSVMVVNPLTNIKDSDKTNILFCTDGSSASVSAAQKLTYLVEKERACVSVINAWYYSDLLVLKNMHELIDIVGLAESLKKQSFKIVKTIVDIFHKNDIKTDKKISKEGKPAKTILDILQKDNYDVVALGCHCKNDFEKFFLGSVSTQVYENSQITTLILKNGNK